MNYEDLLLDFVRRTRENLQITDRWRLEHPEARFNEVTHLINSMLGFIVLPKERILDWMRQVEINSTGIPTWNVAFSLRKDSGVVPVDLRPFVTGIRNAVAHGSFDFISNGRDINSVRFEHKDRHQSQVLWTVDFELGQLNGFLIHLTNEVEDACKRRQVRSLGG